MTINSVDILFSWYDEDKSFLQDLKKRADEGDQECLADFIGIQTELSTDADEVQTNIELLKKLSDQGNSRANLVLGVLYNEGLCKNSKNTDSEIFIVQDFETSDFYLERAAKENNPVALFMLGMHAWFRCHIFNKECESPYKAPTEEDFKKGIKWLKKLISMAEDDSINDAERQYAQNQLIAAKGFLEDLIAEKRNQ